MTDAGMITCSSMREAVTFLWVFYQQGNFSQKASRLLPPMSCPERVTPIINQSLERVPELGLCHFIEGWIQEQNSLI